MSNRIVFQPLITFKIKEILKVMFKKEVIEFLNLLAFFKGDCTAYLVGGAVRDALLGDNNPKDLDIEVHGVTEEQLLEIAKQFGKASLVGQSFGVIKLQHPKLGEIDLSLPRTEKKVSQGHKGFEVQVDPYLGIKAALSRRDFTINAMAWNPSQGLVDPFNGAVDLEGKVLRHVSDQFAEDPLRVLRGMQFCGRFGLTAAPETIELCKTLMSEFHTLAVERVWIEWEKWATKSIVPSKGLQFLADCGWIQFFPEVAAMRDTPQDPTHHPEGEVLLHTALVCDAAANIANREGLSKDQQLVLLMAALCHDMAKPETTEFIGGRWRAIGHEKAGGQVALQFLESLGVPNWLPEKVIPLVENHLAHCNPATPRMVRRLAKRLGKASIQELAWLVEADVSGRPPLPQYLPQSMKDILGLANELNVQQEAQKPILQGRHLIQLGMKPSKEFSVILAKAMEAQLDGEFSDGEEGIEWLQSNVIVQA